MAGAPTDPMLRELMELINAVDPEKIVARLVDRRLATWCQDWKMKASMLVGFLDERLKQPKNEEVP